MIRAIGNVVFTYGLLFFRRVISLEYLKEFETDIKYRNGLLAVLLSNSIIREKENEYDIEEHYTLRLYPENENVIYEIKDILKDKLNLDIALKYYEHTNSYIAKHFYQTITDDELETLKEYYGIIPYIMGYGFNYHIKNIHKSFSFKILSRSIKQSVNSYPRWEYVHMYPYGGLKDYMYHIYIQLKEGNLLYNTSTKY